MPGSSKYKIDKRPLYRDEIKSALMDAITSGELKPGDRIVETRWAKELGVSQSPIREAIRELELIGLCTDICVVSNALLLKAAMPQVRISVDPACCAGVTPQKHAAALETMRSCQIHIE